MLFSRHNHRAICKTMLCRLRDIGPLNMVQISCSHKNISTLPFIITFPSCKVFVLFCSNYESVVYGVLNFTISIFGNLILGCREIPTVSVSRHFGLEEFQSEIMVSGIVPLEILIGTERTNSFHDGEPSPEIGKKGSEIGSPATGILPGLQALELLTMYYRLGLLKLNTKSPFCLNST